MYCENNLRYFKALLENDNKVLEEIYHEIFPPLRKYVQSNNGSEEEAWDLFQEAIVVMLGMARKGAVLKSEFRYYFFGICKNKWIDHLKKTKTYSSLDEHATLLDHRSIVEQDLENQTNSVKIKYEKVIQAYNRLPAKCQAIFKNLFTAEKKIPDIKIAEALEMDYGYFRKEKCKCKKVLLQIIAESNKEHEINQEL